MIIENCNYLGKQQAENYARSVGAKHFNTSAKQNKGKLKKQKQNLL